MRFTEQLLKFIVVIVPLVVLLTMSTKYVVDQSDHALNYVHSIAEDQISKALGRDIIIRSIKIFPIGHAEASGIALPDLPGPGVSSGQNLAMAEKVIVDYDMNSLIAGNGVQSVKKITVNRPVVNLIRRPDGRMNIQDLVKPPTGPAGPPFQGQIRIVDATVLYDDFKGFAKIKHFTTNLRKFNASLDARIPGVYRALIDATGEPDKIKTLRVSARYDAITKAIIANVNVSAISLPYVGSIFGLSRDISISKGDIDIKAGTKFSLANSKIGMRALDASIAFNNLTASSPRFGINATSLSGNAVVTGEQAVVNLAGTFAGSHGEIRGVVSGIKNPKLDFAVDLPNVNYSSILRLVHQPKIANAIHTTGNGRITARINGDATDPYVEATVYVSQIEYGRYVVKQVALHGLYSEGTVDVDGLTFKFEGAKVGLVGNVSGFAQHSPEMNLKGWVRDLNIASVPIPKGYEISGIGGLDLTASGTMHSPRIDAIAWVEKPSAKSAQKSFNADKVYAKLGWFDNTLLVKDVIAAGIFGGTLAVKGQASTDRLDLAVSAKQIDCQKAASAFNFKDLGGYAFYDGRVFGNPRKPWVDGLLEAFSVRYKEYEANYVKGMISGNIEKLKIDDGVVLRSPTDLGFTAELRDIGHDEMPFTVDAIVHRLDIQNTLMMLKRDAEVSGIVSGDLWASGILLTKPQPDNIPFKKSKGSFLANVDDGTAYGYPLKATLSLNYDNDLLSIVKAIAKSDKTELTAGGTLVPSTREINVDFDLQEFDLAELRSRLGNKVYFSGVGGASGTARGTLSDPTIEASGSVDNLLVNSLIFDSTTFEATYASGIVKDAIVELKRGEQLMHLSADKVDIPGKYVVGGNGILKNVSVTDLWNAVLSTPSEIGSNIRKTAGKFPRVTSGVLNGDVKLSGNMNQLNGTAGLDVTNIGLDRDIIESVEMSASMTDGTLNLNQLLAKVGEGTIEAIGAPFYSDGKTKTSFSVRNLNLQSLRPFLGSSTPSGTMEAEFLAEGDIKAPFVRGSLELVRPAFGNFALDGIRAGDIRISLDKSELDEPFRTALGDKQAIVLADDAVVSLADHQLNIGGFAPWDWSAFSIPKDLPLNVTARINNQQMSTLAALSPLFDAANTSGILQGSFDLTGTLTKHQFGGGISLKDGRVALTDFKNKFNNVNLDLGFVGGDQLSVNQFTIGSDLGGKLYVKPGGYVKFAGNPGGETNMQVVADGFKVGEKNFFGLTEDILVKLNAGIGVNGSILKPSIHDQDVDNIKGGITLSDSKMVFAIPEAKTNKASKPYDFDPTFDISMRLGDNVLIQPPALKIVTSGGGKLIGSLNDPDLTLDLGVKQGYMVMAARRMRVTPGGSLAVHYAPPTDLSQRGDYSPEVNVDFHASTSLTATNAFGKKERYLVSIGATGSLAKMNVDLTSKPEGLTKEQILAELGHVGALGSGGVEIEKELSNIVSAVGSSTLFSPIETIFVEQLGFEQFSLDYNRSSQSSLYFSRTLPGNFYVSYFQTLKAGLTNEDSKKFELNLGYRPKGPYQLTVGVDDQQVYSMELSISKLFN